MEFQMKLFDGLAKYRPQALGVLRIMTALQFLEHGSQKLFNFPISAQPHALNSLSLTSGILESCLTSKKQNQQRLETPHLAVTYRPVREPQYAA